MEATATEEAPVEEVTSDTPALAHFYCRCQQRQFPDGLGAVAVCGHTKKKRWFIRVFGEHEVCVVCAEMVANVTVCRFCGIYLWRVP